MQSQGVGEHLAASDPGFIIKAQKEVEKHHSTSLLPAL